VTNVKTQKRLYNVELLRIISMILIIVTHTLGHGGILDGLEKNSFNYFLFNFISSFSIISVNVFVLISGYFLCESKIKIKKILFLILEVFFYSMLIYVVLLITNKIEFSIKKFFYSFFPILTGKYWFISCYVLLYIFSPFLKKIIDNLNKDSHLLLVIFCVIIFSILPTVFFFVDTFNVKGGYSITWFIVLYFIASYIRKYLIIKKNMFYLIVALISTFIIFSSFIFIDNFVTFLTNKLLFEYNSIFVLISSVSIFLKHSESIVSMVSGTTYNTS